MIRKSLKNSRTKVHFSVRPQIMGLKRCWKWCFTETLKSSNAHVKWFLTDVFPWVDVIFLRMTRIRDIGVWGPLDLSPLPLLKGIHSYFWRPSNETERQSFFHSRHATMVFVYIVWRIFKSYFVFSYHEISDNFECDFYKQDSNTHEWTSKMMQFLWIKCEPIKQRNKKRLNKKASKRQVGFLFSNI